MQKAKTSKPENPWVNLAFNVLIPVIILNQLGRRLGENGPVIALILSMAFPIGYGIWDYWHNGRKNFLSVFGLLSVIFTGGFALFELSPGWFAIKEAAFPALIGLGVLASSFTSRPFLQLLILNDQALRMDRLDLALNSADKQRAFTDLVRQATRFLALSFAMSSLLNFLVARWVFTPLDGALSEAERAAQLNEQVAKMTGYGFLLIALPMMIFLGLILFWFFRRLQQLTQLSLEDLLHQAARNDRPHS